MRKILLSLVALAATSGIMSAENFTLVMGDQWGATDCDLTEWTQQGFTFFPKKGENAKDKVPVYKAKNKEVRFYALNTLTVTAPADGEPLTQIVFTLSKQGKQEQAVITASDGEVEIQTVGSNTVTWNGNAYAVTFTVGETNSLHPEGIVDGSGQFDFSQVDVSTGGSIVEKPVDTDTEFFMCNATDENGVLSTWKQGNLIFTAAKGEDETVNDPALKNGDEARFYAGNTLTISTEDGRNITSLEFILSEQGMQQQASVIPSAGTMTQSENNNAKWEGKAACVTFTIGQNEFGTNPAKKGQFDFTQINLGYEYLASTLALVDTDDSNDQVEYYTLQGLRIDNPSSGIFILRQGSKTSKIIIK